MVARIKYGKVYTMLCGWHALRVSCSITFELAKEGRESVYAYHIILKNLYKAYSVALNAFLGGEAK